MRKHTLSMNGMTRRDLLRAGLCGLGIGATGTFRAPSIFGRAAEALAAQAAHNGRILVVLELSGGNDGLNTLVPYGDDAYYRHRPTIGIKPQKLRTIDKHFGFSGGMAGFERLYKDGKLAVVHGCGYDNPSFSHFTSMAYWHTAAPNSGEAYGWIGRVADAMQPQPLPNYLVNIDTTQSLAVKSRGHVPVVFDDPERLQRKGHFQTRPVLEHVTAQPDDVNPARK